MHSDKSTLYENFDFKMIIKAKQSTESNTKLKENVDSCAEIKIVIFRAVHKQKAVILVSPQAVA